MVAFHRLNYQRVRWTQLLYWAAFGHFVHQSPAEVGILSDCPNLNDCCEIGTQLVQVILWVLFRDTGFFQKNSQPTWSLARRVRHPWSPNFNVVWQQCLAEPSKKNPILAPAIEKRWLATLRQGVGGLPVDVETFWSMAVFVWRTRYLVTPRVIDELTAG